MTMRYNRRKKSYIYYDKMFIKIIKTKLQYTATAQVFTDQKILKNEDQKPIYGSLSLRYNGDWDRVRV